MSSTISTLLSMSVGAAFNVPYWAWLFSLMGVTMPLGLAMLSGAVIGGVVGSFLRDIYAGEKRGQIIPLPVRGR